MERFHLTMIQVDLRLHKRFERTGGRSKSRDIEASMTRSGSPPSTFPPTYSHRHCVIQQSNFAPTISLPAAHSECRSRSVLRCAVDGRTSSSKSNIIRFQLSTRAPDSSPIPLAFDRLFGGFSRANLSPPCWNIYRWFIESSRYLLNPDECREEISSLIERSSCRIRQLTLQCSGIKLAQGTSQCGRILHYASLPCTRSCQFRRLHLPAQHADVAGDVLSWTFWDRFILPDKSAARDYRS